MLFGELHQNRPEKQVTGGEGFGGGGKKENQLTFLSVVFSIHCGSSFRVFEETWPFHFVDDNNDHNILTGESTQLQWTKSEADLILQNNGLEWRAQPTGIGVMI